MKKALVIRADASTQIGLGHVMRCLALAQAWQESEGHAIFLMAEVTPSLEARLQSKGMKVIHLSAYPGSADEAKQTADLARRAGASWVVVDGYHFGADYQRIIKDSDLCLLLIDDIGHADHYHADIVLNQNIHANEGLYVNRESYTRLLLGTRYVLLRREFLKWRGWRRKIPEVARRILVTLGGGDPDNMTLKVINALKKAGISDLDVKIVVGPSNPNTATLQNALLFAPCSIRLLHNVTDMPKLIAWADMTISAGGITTCELAFMALPNLALILAENQRLVAEGLHERGVAVNLGWHERLSPSEIAESLVDLLANREAREEMARCAHQLVDGKGVSRVVRCLRKEEIRLREVKKDDCRLLWEWANETDVRSVSFKPEAIPWEQHVRWFKSKVNDPNCIFFIVSNREGTPIGQVRYDLYGSEAVISVSIHGRFRGQGYGSRTILLSSQKVFDASDVRIIHAYAKEGNKASTRAFLKAGFKKTGTKIIDGHRAIDFALIRDTTVWTAISR